MYCGIDRNAVDSSPLHICLPKDDRATSTAGVKFDIDSVTGFPRNLSIAKQGIRRNSTQMPVSARRSSLHLDHRRVFYVNSEGCSRSPHKPVHHIPQDTFRRLVGFEDVYLYLLFPRFYREE